MSDGPPENKLHTLISPKMSRGCFNKAHYANDPFSILCVCVCPGGYTVGPKPLIDLLRQRSRPYLFSNSLPPPVVGCATRAVELLLASNEISQSMVAKTMRCVCVCVGWGCCGLCASPRPSGENGSVSLQMCFSYLLFGADKHGERDGVNNKNVDFK